MENKKKFMSFKDMNTKDYGKYAIVGILAGGWLGNNPSATNFFDIAVMVIGDTLGLLGFIFAVVWLYKVIKKRP